MSGWRGWLRNAGFTFEACHFLVWCGPHRPSPRDLHSTVLHSTVQYVQSLPGRLNGRSEQAEMPASRRGDRLTEYCPESLSSAKGKRNTGMPWELGSRRWVNPQWEKGRDPRPAPKPSVSRARPSQCSQRPAGQRGPTGKISLAPCTPRPRNLTQPNEPRDRQPRNKLGPPLGQRQSTTTTTTTTATITTATTTATTTAWHPPMAVSPSS